MSRDEMVELIRRGVEVRGQALSILTIQLGMDDAGTDKRTAEAILKEALDGLPR